ncbi:hypothetical protein [Tenacibaculum sp.]|uniref:hypothetical protein n=1 Tax=Tenacibaculum sp. TaxID=1906242 RepID=UPI003D12D161
MFYSEEELKEQEIQVSSKLYLVFIPIFIICGLLGYFQVNSLDCNKRRYENNRELYFKGIVIDKRKEGDYRRARKYVVLDSYHEEQVDNFIYKKISVGDSVVKGKGSDSIYFYFKTGKVIIQDYNKAYREKYYKLLNEE